MNKILITGFIGSDNLGDELIFATLIQKLKKHSLDISAITQDHEKTKQFNITPISSRNIFQILTAILNCDRLILNGGGLLQDETSIFNLPYHLWKLILAQLLGKKTCCIGIGAGPIKSAWGRWMVKKIINKSSFTTVRDSESFEFLTSKCYANPKKIRITSDLTLSLEHHDKKVGSDSQPANPVKDKPYVLVCLRHWYLTNRLIPAHIKHKPKSLNKNKEYQSYIKNLANKLDTLINTFNYNIVFFPFYGKRDLSIHQDIAQLMKHSEQTSIISGPNSLNQFLSLATKSELVVSMRLHANIMASKIFKPLIGISYSSKVRSYFQSLNLNKYCLELSELTDVNFIESINDAIKHSSHISGQLETKINQLKEENETNWKLLNEFIH